MSGYDFARVSATAYFPVVARGEYTRLPFAKEMLDYLRRCGSLPDGISASVPGELRGFAPFFEARFQSVSRILAEEGATQILELASGFSPRGMEWSRRGVVYVEADLPGMIEQKRAMISAILGSVPPNLRLCTASALDREALMSACARFRPEPVAVTTEGLLRYLTFPEKSQLAAIVREILAQFGGAWITPDIHLKQWAIERSRSSLDLSMRQRLGRDLLGNYFNDLAHARRFFETCGFLVEERPLLEDRDMVASLALATPSLLDQLEQRRTFILRPVA